MSGLVLFDPVERCALSEADVDVLEAVDGVVPMRRKGAAHWFFHETWTNRSYTAETVDAGVRRTAEDRIARFELTERLLARCDDARGFDQVPPLEPGEADALLEKALRERSEPEIDLHVAVNHARHRGFSVSEIAFALGALDHAATLSDALDGVEVVSVSRLVEELRASTGAELDGAPTDLNGKDQLRDSHLP